MSQTIQKTSTGTKVMVGVLIAAGGLSAAAGFASLPSNYSNQGASAKNPVSSVPNTKSSSAVNPINAQIMDDFTHPTFKQVSFTDQFADAMNVVTDGEGEITSLVLQMVPEGTVKKSEYPLYTSGVAQGQAIEPFVSIYANNSSYSAKPDIAMSDWGTTNGDLKFTYTFKDLHIPLIKTKYGNTVTVSIDPLSNLPASKDVVRNFYNGKTFTVAIRGVDIKGKDASGAAISVKNDWSRHVKY